MYATYYRPDNVILNKGSTSNTQNNKTKQKGTPQYLFLNMIRMFSIAYLVLTIFYVPIYIANSEVNSIYWQNSEQNFTFTKKIFLQGTIFAIRNQKYCYQKIVDVKILCDDNQLNSSPEGNIIKKQIQCFQNELYSLPFIDTVEKFHYYYFWYYLILYLLLFIGVVVLEYFNKHLYIHLEYPLKENQEKSENKKIYHIQYVKDLPIYMLKPLLKFRIENQFRQLSSQQGKSFSIQNIKFTTISTFKKYSQIYQKHSNLLKKIQQNIQTINIETDYEIREEILKLNTLMQVQGLLLQLQKTHLQIQLQKYLENANHYHYKHFWVSLGSFQQCLTLQNYQKIKKSKDKLIFDRLEESDLIIENLDKNEEKLTFKQTSKQHNSDEIYFHPNKNYEILLQTIKLGKIIFGILICLSLIIFVDALILILQKNNVFSYTTVFVVLILEIILKVVIIILSQKQNHTLYSHQHLSIMIKLTFFIFLNLVIILLIGNHNLGNSNFGKLVSTYEFASINEQWFLKIGTSIILIVMIQIIYCNLRVYIEIFKKILLNFIFKRFSSFFKFKKLKQRLQRWFQEQKENYKKPIIDLDICYSQILPIYLIGLIFGYYFPVLYPLLFVFSITVYHTHTNYVELYTQKIQYSRTTLNDWAYQIIYLGFLGGLYAVSFFQEIFIKQLCIAGGLMIVLWICKTYFMRLDGLIYQRLEQLSNKQKKQKQIVIQAQTQRTLKSNLISNITTTKQQNQYQTSLKKDQFLKKQLINKQTQAILLQIFYGKRQNINEIHSEYYQKYKNMIMEETKLLKELIKMCIQKQVNDYK